MIARRGSANTQAVPLLAAGGMSALPATLWQNKQNSYDKGCLMEKEDFDAIISQLLLCLESNICAGESPGLLKEDFFEFFVTLYNAAPITGNTLRDMIYEKWIEKRIKLLNELIDSWEDWTLAWENSDKKKS